VNWDEPDVRQEWYHNMSSVLQAGVCVRSNQMDFDEEVMYRSTQYLYDYVRQDPETQRPFAMTVSLTHPHDPYAISQEYWDRYEDVEIPMPDVDIPQEQQDPHSVRLLKCVDLWKNKLPDEAIKRARRAYYGACSYVDDQVGRLMKTLKNCGLADNTIVVFSGDHGDMLGERGMWYKMSYLEMSARVPMIFHCPSKFDPRRVPQPVSTMDLLPTFVEMIGGKLNPQLNLDGKSLYPALHGQNDENHTVFGEYMGEGTITPVVMIRRKQHKYIASLVDPPQLFNLHDDPKELHNLCESKDSGDIILAQKYANEAAQKWDLQGIHNKAVDSQRQRRLVWEALTIGKFESWDYQPPPMSSQQYIRSNIPLDDLERRARFPVVDMMGQVTKKASSHGAAAAAGQ
jgi:choline-sulfatase